MLDNDAIYRFGQQLQERESSPGKVRVDYHAMNGQVFTTETVWYEMQKAFNELSRQAYENDTTVNFVIVY